MDGGDIVTSSLERGEKGVTFFVLVCIYSALGLCCCVILSQVGARDGDFPVVAHRLLPAAASSVVEHRLQARSAQ